MSDQELPVAPTRRSSPVPWIVLVLVAILVALGVYYLVSRRAGVDPATYLPLDSVMAVTIDLTKSEEKEAALNVIQGIIKDAGIDDPHKWLLERIDKEFDLDFEKDILARINGRAAGAMLPEMTGSTATDMEPTIVLVVGARSEGDAAALMDVAEKKMKQEGVKSEKRAYEGFSYYVVPEDDMKPCLGAVRAALVLASNELGFKKIVDTVKGQPNILQEPNFVKLRESGPATFATFYFSGANYFKFMEPLMARSGATPPEAREAFRNMMENTVAMVGRADASAEGIMFDAKGITKKPMTGYQKLPLAELVSQAPKDAAFVVTQVSIDKAWADFKEQLFANEDFKNQVLGNLAMLKQVIGFDPLADVLDRITAVSVYYTPGLPAEGSEFPGDVTMVLKVDRPAAVASTVNKIPVVIRDVLEFVTGEAVGPLFAEMDIAGRTAYVSPKRQGMQIAFGMVDEELVITLSGSDVRRAMRTAIDLAQGKGDTLASSEAFELVRKYLPKTATSFVLCDAAPVVKMFLDELDLDPEDRKVAEAVVKRIGTFAAAGEVEGTESSVKAVLPFKK